MDLGLLLRAQGVGRVERPPLLWQADTSQTGLAALLAEMIATSLARGGALGALTLNVNNIVVEAYTDGEPGVGPAPGEYVAVTLTGEIDFGADAVWQPGRPWSKSEFQALTARLAPAGVRYAYTRNLPAKGSITVFFARST